MKFTSLLCALTLATSCGRMVPPLADLDGGLPSELDGGEVLDAGNSSGSCTPAQLDQLEAMMGSTLDAAALNPALSTESNYTLILERADGRKFVHSHGTSTPTTSYASASTSKWVSAAVILDLVDQGVLTLDSTPHALLGSFWVEPSVTLRHLLSFRSGFTTDPLACMSSRPLGFQTCVEQLYANDAATAPPPGTSFEYSSSHLQVAGLMAATAAQQSWAKIFEAFKAKTGLFPNPQSVFDMPYATNPLLAGGMKWTAEEYHAFLKALFQGTILSNAMRGEMLKNQRGSATVGDSPIIARFNEDWAYGLGNWLECPTAIGKDTYNCGEGHRNSSSGAYGSYPFIDFDHQAFGILARQGTLGSGHEGVKMYRTIGSLAEQWADNRCNP